MKTNKSNLTVDFYVEAKTNKFSPFNALKMFLIGLPVVLIGLQYMFIILIVNKYASVFLPSTVLLVTATFAQLPLLVIYRVLNNIELLQKMKWFMLVINVALPALNLLLYYLVWLNAIGLSNFMLAAYVIICNLLVLIAFVGFIYLTKKRLFSIFKTLLWSSLIAGISQLFLLVIVSLDFGKVSTVLQVKSFAGKEITIFIICILWYIFLSAFISWFIVQQTKKIVVFNKTSKYQFLGILSIPAAILIFGVFNLLFAKAPITPKGFIQEPILFPIAIVGAIAVVILAIVAIMLHTKRIISTEFLQIIIIVLSIINVSISALCYAFVDKRELVGWAMIVNGLCGIVMHLLFSSLNTLSTKNKSSGIFIEANHMFVIVMIAVVAIITVLHYDIVVSQKLFSPNLIFMALELLALSVMLVNYSRMQSYASLKKE